MVAPLMTFNVMNAKHLLKDAQNGLLGSVANKAIALTFDDFLDHAAEY